MKRQTVDRVVGWIAQPMSVVAAIAASLIMVALVAEVAYRLVTGRSIAGNYEFVETLVVFTVFLGIAQAERNNSHVRVHLLLSKLPSRVSTRVQWVGNAAALVVVAWMAYATSHAAILSFQIQEFRLGIIEFPLWPSKWAIAVGLTLLAVQYLIRCLGLASSSGAPSRA